MPERLLIKEATLVNEGQEFVRDILIDKGRIAQIDANINIPEVKEISAEGLHLLPGCIDDQVHFREPGLTHKADLWHESRAAAAGGVTSFMEMPNTQPQTLTRELLEEKYKIASSKSLVNYSFYMGVSNDNLDEVLQVNYNEVCGIKVFMGSSTGNMLVDNPSVLENLFREAPVLIATHCEDEHTILKNTELALAKYGEDIPIRQHPSIRNREACYLSSSFATSLAKKHNTRLHVLHISTADELSLFDNTIPISNKRITAEACVHHLFFDDNDYDKLGTKIKCNPAIKTQADALAVAKALETGLIDVVATDHAPHTLEEKSRLYKQSPSGLPLVQHPLLIMLTLAEKYNWSLSFIAEKMAHNVAKCFSIKDRGYIREGYWADLVLIDQKQDTLVRNEDLLYKCKWSPFEDKTLRGKIIQTYVNGQCVYDHGTIKEIVAADRLTFVR